MNQKIEVGSVLVYQPFTREEFDGEVRCEFTIQKISCFVEFGEIIVTLRGKQFIVSVDTGEVVKDEGGYKALTLTNSVVIEQIESGRVEVVNPE